MSNETTEPRRTVFFTNGWFAEYDGDGKWLMIDGKSDGDVVRVGFLEPMIERFGLTRMPDAVVEAIAKTEVR